MEINKCICGSVAITIEKIGYNDGYAVSCTICDKMGPYRTRRGNAIQSWNAGRIKSKIGDKDPFAPRDKSGDKSETEVRKEVVSYLESQGFVEVNDKTIGITGWFMINEDVGMGLNHNTPGQPDLWIRCHKWPKGLNAAIELKAVGPSIRKRPNQIVLNNTEAIYICDCVQDVADAIADINKELRG